MELTFADFLGLAAIMTNLYHSILNFENVKIDNEEVEGAARDYTEFLKDSKYDEFMKKVRIS